MKLIVILFFELFFLINCNFSQEATPVYEEELVSENEDDESVHEESSEKLYWMRKHPLNLNNAKREQLSNLGLTMFQIDALYSHIKMFGLLLSVYELQAIPQFTPEIIKRILPYVFAGETTPMKMALTKALRDGGHFMMLRSGRTLEKAKGYIIDSGRNFYLGSPLKLLMRYQFRSESNLRTGFTCKKDAGEELFNGNRKDGFDFYSAHFFAYNNKIPYTVALGDYSVQFGQGLIQWQGFSAGKSLGPIGINRQNKELQPYTGTGESNFYRGAGFTILKKKWKITGFNSFRKLNASLDSDSSGFLTVSSILTSGLNRTVPEISKRKSIRDVAYGGSIRYGFPKGHFAANFVKHTFSLPFSSSDQPYGLFNFQGIQVANGSVDYAISFQNIYAFGEIALDHKKHVAILNGIIVSVDQKADVIFLHRYYDKAYTSSSSNAFGQQATPRNESGIYIGCILRPSKPLQFEIYADMITISWLKYRMDAPAYQKEYAFSMRYIPRKNSEFYTRFTLETKNQNALSDLPMHEIREITRLTWRTHFGHTILPHLTIRQRMEISHVLLDKQTSSGCLFYTEVIYKPVLKNYGFSSRLQFFDISNYDARIYAYEPDVLFNGSTHVIDGKGWRYFFVFQRKFRLATKKTETLINAYLKWSQSFFPGNESIGSGMEAITGSHKSEVKFQMILSFN